MQRLHEKYKYTLIHSLNEIVEVVTDDRPYVTGDEAKNIRVRRAERNQNLSILIDEDGYIEEIGHNMVSSFFGEEVKEIDGSGLCAIPGFIDAHTHAVWAGDRVHEFALKLAGASYEEVHQAGGGIFYTVEHVKKATAEELYMDLKYKLRCMLRAGTTTAEVKSGYGLDFENELKMLKVIQRAKRDPDVAVEISSTYCGAHAVPKNKTSEEAAEDIITNHIPALTDLMQRGELQVENIDVFCEQGQGMFGLEESRKILEAGHKAGLAMNFHGEELHQLKSAEMGAELKARAISHLEEISEEGIQAMAKAGTVAVILPSTAYILHLRPPPVRNMLDAGVPVALGSDYNPNAPCYAMPMIMHLACVNLGMSMDEALAAATLNSAASIGRAKTHGSLTCGKVADIILIEAPKWQHIIYQFGNHGNVISHVIKKGKVVYRKSSK